MITKTLKKQRIHRRVRKKVSGTASKPRLHVFKSNKGIYTQLIDDVNGVTMASASYKEVKAEGNKSAVSTEVGKLIASKALNKGVSEVVFDRGGNLYHGRIKNLAEAAREAGLKF